MKKFYQILWPSCLVAIVAEIVFFAVVDPQDLYLLGKPVHLSSLATYSIGFFAFWATCAASSFATWFMQRSAEEVNRTVSHIEHGNHAQAH